MMIIIMIMIMTIMIIGRSSGAKCDRAGHGDQRVRVNPLAFPRTEHEDFERKRKHASKHTCSGLRASVPTARSPGRSPGTFSTCFHLSGWRKYGSRV